jgi:RNA polymerase sigma factor (sigma-70 family)
MERHLDCDLSDQTLQEGNRLVAEGMKVSASGGIDVEAALVRCARGDRSALRELYEAEAPAMLGIARRILRNSALPEDVVHDAFVRIWRHAGSFNPAAGSGRGWIYMIVRNRAITAARLEARSDTGSDMETLLADAAPADPDAVISQLSHSTSLRRCLETLSPTRRQSVVLAYVHGFTHAELAGRLGVPIGTAKAWVRRSLLALRECLG